MKRRSNDLAILGGHKAISKQPKKYRWIKSVDTIKLANFVRGNSLSGFVAEANDSHLGGEWIRKLENLSSTTFNKEFSVSLNSWTSGLEVMVEAFGFESGSEILVPPWTMSATVASIVNSGLTPRFVDIESETFNIDPESVSKGINKRTKGILAVDLFGRPCRAKELREIADSSDLVLMLDSAQTPLARVDGKHSLHYAHAGGFSFNRHKHLQVGEGGLAVTDMEAVAKIMQYLRNHAEITSVLDSGLQRSKIIGHNLRMGEMEAFLAYRQLLKISLHVERRRNWGRYLTRLLLEKELDGLSINLPEDYDSHDFYILPIRLDVEKTGITSRTLAQALKAEGINILVSEYGLLDALPAFGDFPKEDLSTANELSTQGFLGIYMCGHSFTYQDLHGIADAFEKVWDYRDRLKN